MKFKFLIASVVTIFLFLFAAPKNSYACPNPTVDTPPGTNTMQFFIEGCPFGPKDGYYYLKLLIDEKHLFNISFPYHSQDPPWSYSSPVFRYNTSAKIEAYLWFHPADGTSDIGYPNKEHPEYGHVIFDFIAVENPDLGDSPLGVSNAPKAKDVLCGGFEGVHTALGCIRFGNTYVLGSQIAKIGLSIAGAVALVVISVAAYMYMSSSGDPRRLQAARELMFAAIIGVALLSVSIFMLRLIGVDILGLF